MFFDTSVVSKKLITLWDEKSSISSVSVKTCFNVWLGGMGAGKGILVPVGVAAIFWSN